jgi:hypothetical protein
MGSKLLAGFIAVVGAAMVADVLLHPAGTHEAGLSIVRILQPTLRASAGQKI